MVIDLTDSELRNFMREIMAKKGLNVNSWSKLAKKSEGTLRQFFDDPTRSLKVSTLKDYLDAVGMRLSDVRKPMQGLREEGGKFLANKKGSAEQGRTVPVTGYICTNGRFFAYEGKKALEEIAVTGHTNIPASEIIALKVKGDDMLPVMRDGWIIYCHAENDIKSCLNQLCFVHVAKGGSYIRELREGRKKGTYMLISHNGALMDDVKIDWAYPIISIQPN